MSVDATRAVAPLSETFRRWAVRSAEALGSSWAFFTALLVIVLWAVSGPFFGFSDTWQLIINTGTTVVTFLMVFLIQNAQNRDAKALHLKLDELIHAMKEARNELIDVEDLTDEELTRLQQEFARLRESPNGGTR
jgi:low affinity Fe/Cu permease